MNKKGFTLIELLSIIVVIGIILAIVVPSVVDTINDSKEKAYNTTIESVKAAAESYLNFSFETFKSQFSSPGYVEITVEELIDEGFLPAEIKSPLTKQPLTGTVTITKLSENNYVYEFNE
ncbi:MAG: prepilin-type N-terminal cleavage/methylation domain-containing protein [Tenericutes bacterium]|jgi:prepilin-type N-terminal cleavage/methylation domain-containing protein|nr:prepilin-type N-terminal cleavage/methylation domain-containing protein [Bacilli bacterium]MDD4831391.1 prepilin-type N-terminal cleavage/methylation domain-containing protein [Bacilli bacterium]NLV90000.1 prepilin-type N-terminal cleavage/methylation domain-containing protein [Mycoplasmatota bacterium]